MRFFLNREIPREQFVFAIRSFSGQVSWDASVALGATYQESDESITHQIVDRPIANNAKTYLNRVYVQPQWVFDCINENMILPHEDYLPGAVLPPHLSPFVDHADGQYVPPEKQRLIKMKLGIAPEENVLKTTAMSNESAKTTNGSQKSETKQVAKKEETKKKEEVKKEDEESDDEDENMFDGMKVDLDTPDEEESEEEEEEIEDSEDEQELKKKTAEVKIFLSFVRYFNFNLFGFNDLEAENSCG